MLISGEAGVGKTSLMRRFCEVQTSPIRVLWGGCEPLCSPTTAGTALRHRRDHRRRFEESSRGESRPLRGRDRAAAGAHTARPGDRRARGRALGRRGDAGRAAAARRRVGTVPALVIASYRDDELDRSHPLRVTFGELAGGRRSTLRRCSRPPRSRSSPRRIGVDAAELYRRTAGNPFFVTEALAAGGVETARDRPRRGARPGARLGPSARQVLDAAAIVPGAVDLPLLEALAGERDGALGECLSSACSGPRAPAWPSGTSSRASRSRGELAPHRRLALHRRALDASRGRFVRDKDRADPARLAYHAEGAGDAEAVLRFARAAAERAAARRAHRQAADQYARALRFADQLPLAARADAARAALARVLPRRSVRRGDRGPHLALECRRQLGDQRREGDCCATCRACSGVRAHSRRPSARATRPLRCSNRWAAPASSRWPMRNSPAGHERRAPRRHRRVGRACAGARARARGRGDRVPRARPIGDDRVPGARAGRVEPRPRPRCGSRSIAASPTRPVRGYSNLIWAAVRHREVGLAERYLERGDSSTSADPEFDLAAASARIPRPDRARPRALGRCGGDRGAGDPRAARLAAARACSR